MGGFISLERQLREHGSQRPPQGAHRPQSRPQVAQRAQSPSGSGLLEPYKDMPRPGSGVLEPMAGFLDFNEFKEALDLECQNESNREDPQDSDYQGYMFFPVDLEFDKMFDWAKVVNGKNNNTEKMFENNNNNNNSEQMSATGKLININNTDVAVFRYGDKVLATSEACPHAGGPLHLGDIEEMPDRSLCVRCPWHRWAFRLDGQESAEVGQCVFPKSRRDKRLKVFPVQLDQTTSKIKIGFDSFHLKTLRDEDY